MNVFINAENLSLGYGRKTVLRGIHWTVQTGEFWFLLGPNGHGKSTLLKALLGLLKPLDGTLTMAESLRDHTRVGFVPQRCDLNPTLPSTVREFVSLGLVGLRVCRADREDRVNWALSQVGLPDKRLHSYWSLSGGQRQRALLARALVRRPTLLILDEPTNGLDLTTEDSLLVSLARLNREEGITILFVTHDLPIAARYASHAALFAEGTMRCGSRHEMLVTNLLTRTYGLPVSAVDDGTGALSIGVHRGDEAV